MTSPIINRSPLTLLSISLICELFAGILFWWPAITLPLQTSLHLTSSQSFFLLSIANASMPFGTLAGQFQHRYGIRITAITGILGNIFCLLFLSFLTFFSRPFFLLLIPIPPLMAIFCFMIYSASMTLSVAVMPSSTTGRVVALCASMFAASPGVFAAVQTVWLQKDQDIGRLLISIAAVYIFPLTLVCGFVPNGKRFCIVEEEESMGLCTERGNVVRRKVRSVVGWVVGLLLCLQIAAVSDFLEWGRFIQLTCVVLGLIPIMGILMLSVGEKNVMSVVEEQVVQVEREQVPVWQVISDKRYLFIGSGYLLLVGAAGLGTLTQLPHLSISRFREMGDGIQRIIRSLVMVFSANNVLGRVLMAIVADYGKSEMDRYLFKYRIVHLDTLLMACAMVLITIPTVWGLYLAMALTGFCYGTWFSITPTLISLWFGLQSFARNFAYLGLFAGAGTLLFATILPTWLMNIFANHWDRETNICIGWRCFAPYFLLLAFLLLVLFTVGHYMRKTISQQAEFLFQS